MLILASNKQAYYKYAVEDKIEAGIVLKGTETKSCRDRNISLQEAYARPLDNEILLIGLHIAPYAQGNRLNHNPRRDRKLLLHKREIRKLTQAVTTKGLTLVPLRIYLNDRGKVKVELGLCRGKKLHDKREDLKKQEHDREAHREMSRKRRSN